ncbi:MAG: alpha/beta fold hydrolase [Pseudomonadota bacterium]
MQAYQPERSPRVDIERVGSVDISVRVWAGSGKHSLFALHGWGDVGASFQFFADVIGEDFTVIAPDWRGFGDSVSRESSYYFPNYFVDLEALLTRYCGDAPVNLLGHSMGGNIASLYAGMRPARVARVFNVEGFGLPDSEPNDAPQRYAAWLDSLLSAPSDPDYPDAAALAARVQRRSPTLAADRALYIAEQWGKRDPDTGRWRLRQSPAHRRPNPVLYRRAEARACWQATRAPTVVIRAEPEAMPGLDAGCRDFAAALGERCVAVESMVDTGHNLHMERPAELARLVRHYWDAAPD